MVSGLDPDAEVVGEEFVREGNEGIFTDIVDHELAQRWANELLNGREFLELRYQFVRLGSGLEVLTIRSV